MSVQRVLRKIELSDREAGKYFQFLEDFFGTEVLDDKLTRIEREIQQEKGVYLQYWVLPRKSFWLGIKAARNLLKIRAPFTSSLTPNMYLPLEFAAKLMLFKASMPHKTLNEFKERMLAAESISPIFFEINIASHFWQLGYEINWREQKGEPGAKIPEFDAVSAKESIEVECKAKTPDAGRKITRKDFYRLFDKITDAVSLQGFYGLIQITIPDRLKANKDFQTQIIDAISSNLKNLKSQINLDSGIEILIDLKNDGKVPVDRNDVIAKIRAIRKPHSQIAIVAPQEGGRYINPLILCIDSKIPDNFLTDIFESLKKANHQFSQMHPSLICCFIPELQDFVGLENKSALKNMTEKFFVEHAEKCVFAVSYVSEAHTDEVGIFISKSMPSLTFYNPNYNKDLGDIKSISLPVDS